jgi:hypothetical protein
MAAPIAPWGTPSRLGALATLVGLALSPPALAQETQNPAPPIPDASVTCDVLVVGGGLAGTATAYEALRAGRTVCLTDITDWVGGQISSQGTTALDEVGRQRALLFYAQGYLALRDRIPELYDGDLNPGDCWVSATCFLPADAHQILSELLLSAAQSGGGELKWFPHTVAKDVTYSADGRQIASLTAIQHQAAPGTPPLNTEPLSAIIADAYRYGESDRLTKTVVEFVPAEDRDGPADWYVIEATETGELIGLTQIPHRLGLDARSPLDPSSPVTANDPYCTQGFTYTFAMAATAEPQPHPLPDFYAQYAPYFSYERARSGYTATDYYDFVFTYRRLWAVSPPNPQRIVGVGRPQPGDISMQNWTWGNDYRPGTAQDNLIYTTEQLQALGQLAPGGWLGGLRTEALQRGEENAIAYYYWLATGDTDSQLGEGVKVPNPYSRFLQGFDAPMNTAHGLSKYPYIREGRRIIGRPSYGYEDGFAIHEVDFSWADFASQYYREALSPQDYIALWRELAGLEVIATVLNNTPPDEIERRTRSRIYPDSVGIAQYAIDFHPCMAQSPPEAPGNIERPGVRQAHGRAYPAQIPLRSLIPQRLDNLLVSGKGMATSTIAAAAYRVHSFEWSVGAAAGTTVDFALRQGVLPYELVDDLPRQEPLLLALQQELQANDNPTAFPNTTIFNEAWEDWRPW